MPVLASIKFNMSKRGYVMGAKKEKIHRVCLMLKAEKKGSIKNECFMLKA